MELKKKLILDEAPQILNEISKQQYRNNHKKAMNNIIAKKNASIPKEPDTTIRTQDWRSDGYDRPDFIEKEFNTVQDTPAETLEHQLEIMHQLFIKAGVDNPSSDLKLSIVNQFLSPAIWVSWFKAMKAKEILKGTNNVFMNILADQRSKNTILKDPKVFYTAYNAYANDALDETISNEPCGTNFKTLVMNPSTYTNGQPMRDVIKTFKLINSKIQKSDGSKQAWTDIFNNVCDHNTQALLPYDDISKEFKNGEDITVKSTGTKEKHDFNQMRQAEKKQYLDNVLKDVVQDSESVKYLDSKLDAIKNK